MESPSDLRHLKEVPDAALVRAAHAGSLTALGELSRRHRAALMAFLYRVSGNLTDAEDFAQEAFISAWRKIGGLKDPGAFKSWLFTLALRLVKDRQKSRIRSLLRDRQWQDLQHAVTGGRDFEHARLDIDKVLSSLPDKERLVAALIYGAGFSQTEASRITEIPLGSVKTYSLRARAVLVEALREWRTKAPSSKEGNSDDHN